jgi:gliding motility-associated protein GldE
MTSAILIALAVEVILLAMSALISSSEVSFFSLGPSEIEELHNDKSESSGHIVQLLEKPDRLLATILISNNFVNVGIVILSSYIIAEGFNLGDYPLWLSFAIQVGLVTFLLLLIGEVIPKVYATNHGILVCKFMAAPLLYMEKICYPLSMVLISSTNIINRRVKKKGHDYSADELGHALELTKDAQISPDEEKILKGIVRFGNTDVKQILTARTEVLSFDYDTPFRELLDELLQHGFSRVPIYRNSLDNVVGILYLKDLLPHSDENNMLWQKLLRKPYFVPENKKLDDLMQEFQAKKVHMAIVVDEYGGTTGIVTLEDIIEEIVGDITDEYDDEDVVYSKLDDRNYVFEGKTPLVDIYKILDINGENFEEAKGESDTLAGFILELSGRIPPKNEKVRFEDYLFTVEAADKRRVKRVKITLPEMVVEERRNT